VAHLALVAHPGRAAAVALADDAVAWLKARGHDASIVLEGALPSDCEVIVSLGGDGTMLHAVALAGAAVPVLGVNVGHLGYLTEVEPDWLMDALERFLAGDYRIEHRMTLDIDAGGSTYHALNEAVVEKTLPGHTVRMAMTIDGEPLVTYAADGLIVATPTGSTAYNLSARGPICSPTHRALVVTPVSAHMLFDRSLVLDPAEVLALEVLGPTPARLVVDGRVVADVAPGDVVRCRVGGADAKLVTFGTRNFHRILQTKFGLADR